MLQICPRIPNQQFDELPFKEAILTFLRELGYNGEIKMITDVNINKLYQPWRSFAAVINKCLSGHSTEHKDAKKSNEMYYPCFTKVIINFFMAKDQSILRRNKYGAILPIELTNEAIRNSKSYKEYRAIASGAKPPKTKERIRKNMTKTHISYANGSGADEGTDNDKHSHMMNVDGGEMDDEGANEEDEANELYRDVNISLVGRDIQMEDVQTTQVIEDTYVTLTRVNPEVSDCLKHKFYGDFITESTNSKAYKEYYACATGEASPKPKASAKKKKASSESDKDNDDNNDEEEPAKNDDKDTESGKGGDEVSKSEREGDDEETRQEEEESFDPIPRTLEGSEDESNNEEDQESRLSEEARIQEEEEADELYPFRFDERLRSLETTFSEYRQTNLFVDVVSAILGIVQQYMTQQMAKAVREAALVEAYDADKAILDTYGESTILKRRREDDDQEGPSAGSDRGSKRQKKGGEHASASTPSETTTGSTGRTTKGSQSRQLSTSEFAFAEEPVQTTC
nr:hypothetical protein [Tanacetum cinerariifolium]